MAETTDDQELIVDNSAEQVGEPTDSQEAAPNLTDVVIGGQTFKVDSDLARAYDVEKVSRQEQLENLKIVQESAPRSEEQPIKAEGFDYETALFTDANEAVKRIKQEAIGEALTVMKEDRARERTEERFWTTLHEKNPDLKGEDFIVKGVVSENIDALRGLPKDKVVDVVAAKSMERIRSIAQWHGAPTSGDRDVKLTSANPPGRKKTAGEEKEDNLPKSLGDAIKRQRNRGSLKVAS